jgi:LysM repeat protein
VETGVRQAIARVAAPLAFLLLATLGVVAVRSALDDPASTPPPAATTANTATATTATAPAEQPTTATAPAGQGTFYSVRQGDTLESIAASNDTTVEQLLILNPGIDPVALRIGQRIRVG